jgi:hypothetical protein
MPTERLPFSGFQVLQPATGEPENIKLNSLAAYRIHDPDPVLFTSSLRFSWIASSDNAEKNGGFCNYDYPVCDPPPHTHTHTHTNTTPHHTHTPCTHVPPPPPPPPPPRTHTHKHTHTHTHTCATTTMILSAIIPLQISTRVHTLHALPYSTGGVSSDDATQTKQDQWHCDGGCPGVGLHVGFALKSSSVGLHVGFALKSSSVGLHVGFALKSSSVVAHVGWPQLARVVIYMHFEFSFQHMSSEVGPSVMRPVVEQPVRWAQCHASACGAACKVGPVSCVRLWSSL